MNSTNPVIHESRPMSIPGWVIREYRNGEYDAADEHGVAVTVGFSTFAEAFDAAKSASKAAR